MSVTLLYALLKSLKLKSPIVIIFKLTDEDE